MISQTHRYQTTKSAGITLLAISLWSAPVYANDSDDFAKLYGTYKLVATESKANGSNGNNNETYTGALFIVRSHTYDKHPSVSAVHIRPNAKSYYNGIIVHEENKPHFKITYKSTGKGYKTHHHIAHCIRHTGAKYVQPGQARFDCAGNMRAKLLAGTFTLTQLTGKAETQFLKHLFRVKADAFVGDYTLADGSSDLKQTKTRVTLRKNHANFLDARIENELSTFTGVVKPSGMRSVFIQYKNERGEDFQTDCSFTLNQDTQKVRMVNCQGTLQGVHNISQHKTFNLEPTH